MTEPMRAIMEKQLTRVMENLKKNNMEAYYVPTAAAVADFVEGLMKEGDTVAVGGSESLKETGLLGRLASGRYHFLDRYAPGLTGEDKHRIFVESFGADVYLCSANAVTLNGELYNVDGNSNRVAAICYGPASVILVVGCNKLVSDLDGAVRRVKQIAAPANCVRLGCDTYCAAAGVCKGLENGVTAGCGSPTRVCCSYVVSGWQRQPGRIKVVLVGEPLGY